VADITIIFITLNKLPKAWQEFHKKTLLEAADGAPIISLSKEPVDFGLNILQTEEPSLSNIYWQIFKGAKIAKTPYIAVAEDDTLYPKEHFRFRPPLDTVAYNRSRWGLLTWGEPFYYYKARSGNCVMVAPRKLAVAAFTERFLEYPVLPSTCELADNRTEKRLGLTLRKHMKFYTHEPVLQLNHIYSHNPMEQRMHKKAKPIQAYDIPKWGHASKIREKFH
jgi:hypothetical protein